MSKTVAIETNPARRPLLVDLDEFATAAHAIAVRPTEAVVKPRWIDAGLFAAVDSKHVREYVLTPRGQDLLASIDSIPDDPVPEQPKVTPCKSCEGTGERPLFVSMETCDACGGSGQTRTKALRIKDARVTINGVGVGPYNADDYYTQVNGLDLAGQMLTIGVHGPVTSYDSEAPSGHAWRTEGLPDVGRYAEVKISTGEVLYGRVESVDPSANGRLGLNGPKSMPSTCLDWGGFAWFTWSANATEECTRVGWRYADTARNPCKATMGAFGGHSDMLSSVVEAGVEAERQRARLGYSATFTCDKVYSDGWWLAGLPEVGRHVEVKVRSGEVLRGQVTETDPAWRHCMTIRGCESRPLAERLPGSPTRWTTWSSAHEPTYERVGWRYVDAPKLDAPDDSR